MKPIAGLLFVALLAGSPLAAQDGSAAFEGSWTMDTSRSGSSAPGREIPITQAAQVIKRVGTELNIEATRNGSRQLVRYPTKMAEQPAPVGTSGSNTGIGSIVKWDGAELSTSTPIQVNGMTMTVYERRYIGPGANEMTVETTVRVEHGYQGLSGNGNNAEVVKDVYLRSK